MIEGVAQAVGAGMHPQPGKRPDQLSPDLSRTLADKFLTEAKGAIYSVFGVLPGLQNPATTGPMVREAQRHLATWQLQPLAMLMAEECADKLGTDVMIDTLRPLQAFDAGGRARAPSTVIEAMARAKELGLTPGQVNAAMTLVNWGEGDKAA